MTQRRDGDDSSTIGIVLRPDTDRTARFHTDGFVVMRRLFSTDEASTLQKRIDRYVRDELPRLPPQCGFYDDRRRPETLRQLQFLERSPLIAPFAYDARLSGLAREFLGEEAVLRSAQWFDKPPGTGHPATPPHQDNGYLSQVPASVVTFWISLDHVDEENGCPRYVPGSHLAVGRDHRPTGVLGFSLGIPQLTEEDRRREVPLRLEPGDAVAHHCWTIHRAARNESPDRHRRAFVCVFIGVSCRTDPDGLATWHSAMETMSHKIYDKRGPAARAHRYSPHSTRTAAI